MQPGAELVEGLGPAVAMELPPGLGPEAALRAAPRWTRPDPRMTARRACRHRRDPAPPRRTRTRGAPAARRSRNSPTRANGSPSGGCISMRYERPDPRVEVDGRDREPDRSPPLGELIRGRERPEDPSGRSAGRIRSSSRISSSSRCERRPYRRPTQAVTGCRAGPGHGVLRRGARARPADGALADRRAGRSVAACSRGRRSAQPYERRVLLQDAALQLAQRRRRLDAEARRPSISRSPVVPGERVRLPARAGTARPSAGRAAARAADGGPRAPELADQAESRPSCEVGVDAVLECRRDAAPRAGPTRSSRTAPRTPRAPRRATAPAPLGAARARRAGEPAASAAWPALAQVARSGPGRSPRGGSSTA